MLNRRKMLQCLAALAVPSSSVRAEVLPQYIKFVVPLPAGTTTDTITRVVAESLAKKIGQTIVVENRPGANGTSAGMSVARAPPDGSTLLMGISTALSAAPFIQKSVPYDPVKDFSPVCGVGEYSYVLAANAPVNTFAEFIVYAQRKSGILNYGRGHAPGKIFAAELKALVKFDAEEIFYDGEPRLILDLIAGRLDFAFITTALAVEHVRRGTLKALAIATGRRSILLPEVPTMTQAGLPEFVPVKSWAGVFGPAKLPQSIIDYLAAGLEAVLDQTNVKLALQAIDFRVQYANPETLAATVQQGLETWRTLTRTYSITPQ